MDTKPITLIVNDPLPAASEGIPLWASISVVAAAAVAVAGVYLGVRRWAAGRQDPHALALGQLATSLRLAPSHIKTVKELARDERHALALLVSSAALSEAVERRLDLPATKRDARGLAELLTTMNGVG